MARNKYPLRIAAVFRYIPHRPRKGSRRVLDMRRMRHRWRQAIADDNGYKSGRGKPLPDRRIVTVCTVSTHQLSAVNPEQDRCGLRSAWYIDVEPMLGIRTPVDIRNVLH